MEVVPPSAIQHARQYPFAIPAHSYLYLDGRHWKLDMKAGGNLLEAVVHHNGKTEPLASIAESVDLDSASLLASRVAVLSLGSNASPDQLGRKFSALPKPVFIPVIRGQLLDFDVVYSAHITRYGSVPAALAASTGTQVQVFINLLDESQLEVMHHTESVGRNYAFSRLEGIKLELEGGAIMDEICFYRSRHGVLKECDHPIALAAIPALGRSYPALNEAEALAWVRDKLAPDTGLDEFIAANIASAELRQRRIDALSAFSTPADYPYQDIIG